VLYVPPNSLDAARRLCAEYQVVAAEIWTYHTAADQVRFTMVYRAPEAQLPRVKADTPAAKPRDASPAPKIAPVKKPAKPAARTAKVANVKKATRPTKPAKPTKAAKANAKGVKAAGKGSKAKSGKQQKVAKKAAKRR
jgi:hypothetical protein